MLLFAYSVGTVTAVIGDRARNLFVQATSKIPANVTVMGNYPGATEPEEQLAPLLEKPIMNFTRIVKTLTSTDREHFIILCSSLV